MVAQPSSNGSAVEPANGQRPPRENNGASREQTNWPKLARERPEAGRNWLTARTVGRHFAKAVCELRALNEMIVAQSPSNLIISPYARYEPPLRATVASPPPKTPTKLLVALSASSTSPTPASARHPLLSLRVYCMFCVLFIAIYCRMYSTNVSIFCNVNVHFSDILNIGVCISVFGCYCFYIHFYVFIFFRYVLNPLLSLPILLTVPHQFWLPNRLFIRVSLYLCVLSSLNPTSL